ncbi:MAG: exodeoxyribonuclease VII large subunit [Thiomonas sp.]
MVWSVSALIQAFSDALNARFNSVTVRGEVSGLVRAGSGHQYFNLKDGTAQLRCVLFRQRAATSALALRDGLSVRLRATVAIYEPRGDLQLIVESVQADGEGALLEAFLRLKQKLQAEGLFDAQRKRALPAMPGAVGVITSLQAAALHDVLTALRRRSPHVRVVVYPASVQGAQAPGELLAALQRAQARREVDLILLVRGGGSLDDLWAFNDETLVRAIAACSLPVVCGVGHETDFTLADFAADLRAPTPTAAAELGVPSQQALISALDRQAQRLHSAMHRYLQREQQRCDRLALRWPQRAALLAAPLRRLAQWQWRLRQALIDLPNQQAQRLQGLQSRLEHALQRRLPQERERLDRAARALPLARAQLLRNARQRLDHAAQQLMLLSPRATLARGYLLGLDARGQVLRDVSQLRPGAALELADAQHAIRMDIAQVQPEPHPLDVDIPPA